MEHIHEELHDDPAAVRAHLLERLGVFRQEYAMAGSARQTELLEHMEETTEEIRSLVRENSVARFAALIEQAPDEEPAHLVLEAAGFHPEHGFILHTFVDGPRHADGRLMTFGDLRAAGNPAQESMRRFLAQQHDLAAVHSPRRHTITEVHGRILGGEILREMRDAYTTLQKHLEQT